jgi:hypothetical protein
VQLETQLNPRRLPLGSPDRGGIIISKWPRAVMTGLSVLHQFVPVIIQRWDIPEICDGRQIMQGNFTIRNPQQDGTIEETHINRPLQPYTLTPYEWERLVWVLNTLVEEIGNRDQRPESRPTVRESAPGPDAPAPIRCRGGLGVGGTGTVIATRIDSTGISIHHLNGPVPRIEFASTAQPAAAHQPLGENGPLLETLAANPKSRRRGRTPGKRTKIDDALEVLQRRLKDRDSLDIALIAREAGIKDRRLLDRSKRFMKFYSMSIKSWEDNQEAHRAMGLARPLAQPKRGGTSTQDTEPATWDDEHDDNEDWESRVDERGFCVPDDDEE